MIMLTVNQLIEVNALKFWVVFIRLNVHFIFQIHNLNPSIQMMSYETLIAKCNNTMGNKIHIFLKDIPTLRWILLNAPIQSVEDNSDANTYNLHYCRRNR